jgi:branched-subunit amino acid ABC-type transport system permease component
MVAGAVLAAALYELIDATVAWPLRLLTAAIVAAALLAWLLSRTVFAAVRSADGVIPESRAALLSVRPGNDTAG